MGCAYFLEDKLEVSQNSFFFHFSSLSSFFLTKDELPKSTLTVKLSPAPRSPEYTKFVETAHIHDSGTRTRKRRKYSKAILLNQRHISLFFHRFLTPLLLYQLLESKSSWGNSTLKIELTDWPLNLASHFRSANHLSKRTRLRLTRPRFRTPGAV